MKKTLLTLLLGSCAITPIKINSLESFEFSSFDRSDDSFDRSDDSFDDKDRPLGSRWRRRFKDLFKFGRKKPQTITTITTEPSQVVVDTPFDGSTELSRTEKLKFKELIDSLKGYRKSESFGKDFSDDEKKTLYNNRGNIRRIITASKVIEKALAFIEKEKESPDLSKLESQLETFYAVRSKLIEGLVKKDDTFDSEQESSEDDTLDSEQKSLEEEFNAELKNVIDQIDALKLDSRTLEEKEKAIKDALENAQFAEIGDTNQATQNAHRKWKLANENLNDSIRGRRQTGLTQLDAQLTEKQALDELIKAIKKSERSKSAIKKWTSYQNAKAQRDEVAQRLLSDRQASFDRMIKNETFQRIVSDTLIITKAIEANPGLKSHLAFRNSLESFYTARTKLIQKLANITDSETAKENFDTELEDYKNELNNLITHINEDNPYNDMPSTLEQMLSEFKFTEIDDTSKEAQTAYKEWEKAKEAQTAYKKWKKAKETTYKKLGETKEATVDDFIHELDLDTSVKQAEAKLYEAIKKSKQTSRSKKKWAKVQKFEKTLESMKAEVKVLKKKADQIIMDGGDFGTRKEVFTDHESKITRFDKESATTSLIKIKTLEDFNEKIKSMKFIIKTMKSKKEVERDKEEEKEQTLKDTIEVMKKTEFFTEEEMKELQSKLKENSNYAQEIMEKFLKSITPELQAWLDKTTPSTDEASREASLRGQVDGFLNIFEANPRLQGLQKRPTFTLFLTVLKKITENAQGTPDFPKIKYSTAEPQASAA